MLYPPELRARPSEAPLAGPATRGARIIRKHLKERQFALPEARTAAAAREPHRTRASAAPTIPQCTAVRGAALGVNPPKSLPRRSEERRVGKECSSGGASYASLQYR